MLEAVVSEEKPRRADLEQTKDGMKRYIEEIDKNPLLTSQEEYQLGKRLVELRNKGFLTPNEEEEFQGIKTKFVESNLRLVVKIAHDFKGLGLPLLDLIQEGSIGLMRSTNLYDPDRGAKYSSYAAWWIKQGMRRAIANQSRTIRIPVQTGGKISKLKIAETEFEKEFKRKPTEEELSYITNYTKRVIKTLNSGRIREFSIHSEIQSGEDGTFEDIIEDPNARTPYQIISEDETIEVIKKFVDALSNEKDKRLKEVIELRFGLNGEKPLTLEEVSERIGKTRERVRQIENRAIEKIRGMLQSEGYNIRKGHTNKNIDERLQRNYTQQINSPSEDEQDKESRLEKITQRIKFNGRSRKVEKSYNSYEQDKKSVLDEYYSGTNEIKELSIKLGIKEWKIIKILSEEGLEFEGRKNSNSLSEREIPKDYNTPQDAVVSEEDFKKAQRTKQLEEISKKKQEIIRLYQEEKLSGGEIAEKVGCSRCRVYQILQEGKIQMREKTKKKKQDTNGESNSTHEKRDSTLEKIAIQDEKQVKKEKTHYRKINEGIKGEIIESYLNDNKNPQPMMDKYGLSRTTVLNYWKKEGLTPKKRGREKQGRNTPNYLSREEALKIYEECENSREFSKRTGMGLISARNYLKSIGIELKPGKKKTQNSVQENPKSYVLIPLDEKALSLEHSLSSSKRIWSCIDRLEEPQKTLLYSIYLERKSIQQISEETGQERNYITQERNQALNLIAKLLDETPK